MRDAEEQEHIDRLFERANRIIHKLPTVRDPDSFYNLADVGSTESRAAWEAGADLLLKVASDAPDEVKFYFLYWAGDVYIGLGELQRALHAKPQPPLGGRASVQTDTILSLKLAIGQPATGTEIATLFGPRLTKFGRDNVAAVATFLEAKVALLQEHDRRNLLQEWAEDGYRHPAGMTLFDGHASYVLTKYPPAYSFSLSATAEAMCSELMREAENTFREERDIPRVGEGWVAETALFYEVSDAFPAETVIQHGRPSWLGRQHLDVFMPERGIALEYQGEQHDRPIAFFGGAEAYKKNVERDRRKLAKCRLNGVRVIYVRAGYVLGEVISAIRRGADAGNEV